MGLGEIISGGENGQYQVKLIFDKTNYNALLAALNARIPELETLILDIEAEIFQIELDISILNSNIVSVRSEIENIIAERATYPPESEEYKELDGLLTQKEQELNNLISQKNKKYAERNVKRRDKSIRELEKSSLEKKKQYIILNFPSDETLSAWCADLTENLSGNVGTIEIPGERGTVLIQPGYEDNAVYNLSRDGQIQPTIAANPYQTYYNLAMFPGWQKWKPTFRFGTITSIDYDNDLASVTLDNALSSQQALDINQSNALENVPVEYMQCNSVAFEVDDEVVIRFEYDWNTPKIIGFKDNPAYCAWEEYWDGETITSNNPWVIFYSIFNTHDYTPVLSDGKLNLTVIGGGMSDPPPPYYYYINYTYVEYKDFANYIKGPNLKFKITTSIQYGYPDLGLSDVKLIVWCGTFDYADSENKKEVQFILSYEGEFYVDYVSDVLTVVYCGDNDGEEQSYDLTDYGIDNFDIISLWMRNKAGVNDVVTYSWDYITIQ